MGDMITASPSGLALVEKAMPRSTWAAAWFLCLAFAAACTAAIPPDFQAKLDHARLTLGISEASQQSIEHELGRLRSSDDASSEALRQYEEYSARVAVIVDRQRDIVMKMEALAASMDSSPAAPPPSAEADPDLAPSLPRATDEAARLEASFDASLYAFDAALMNKLDELARELEHLSDAASDEAGSLASAIETARQRLDGQGGGMEGAGQEPGDGRDGSAAGQEGGAEGRGDETADADRDRGGTAADDRADQLPAMDQDQAGRTGTDSEADTGRPAATPGMPGTTSPSTSSGPTDFRGDDDIIARQLREAAEKETDPVMKQKLWDEYRRYKQSGTL